MLRFDSIAMAWHDNDRPEMAVVAVAVDRAGHALAGQIPRGGSAADVSIGDEASCDGDESIAVLLYELLQAQYTWTSATFGTIPLRLAPAEP